MTTGKFRIKIRKVDEPPNEYDVGFTGWEVFSVNGEALTLPMELGEWLTTCKMEMAFLIVEPL